MTDAFRSAVYALIAVIPQGRVATYGQVAALAGRPRAARQVGYALAATPPGLSLPWQRVVNAKGEISPRADPADADYQRLLLEAEGVRFDLHGRISLEHFGWNGMPDVDGSAQSPETEDSRMMNIEQLNQRFGLDGQLAFEQGPGGFTLARMRHAEGEALISNYGGQLLHFRPAGVADDLLFVSRQAYFQAGKAIKGGVPVCWPWFGPDPEGLGRPAHGLVRNRPWQVQGSARLDDGRISLTLGLSDSDDTRALWPFAFDLTIEFRLGADLAIELTTVNNSDKPMPLSQALHSYFLVGDIARVKVEGLDGSEYLDKLDDGRRKPQAGNLTVDGALDRIYLGAGSELVLHDAQLARRILIQSSGSASAVVWNPWVEGAAQMADLDDADYRHMLCVETANAADDARHIAPGGEHRLGVRYRVESD